MFDSGDKLSSALGKTAVEVKREGRDIDLLGWYLLFIPQTHPLNSLEYFKAL